jgi:RNA polymerase sigma factor (sigma-70 family)
LTRNATLRYLDRTQKHSASKERGLSPEIRDPSPAPKTDNIKKEEEAILLEALSGLESSYREVIYLKFFSGLPLSEISEITGKPVSTVGKHIQKGLRIIEAVIGSLNPENS